MQRLKKFLLFILAEILVVFALLYTFNNHIGNDDETIKSDGIGYYDYLPSIFIHGDFNRHNSTLNDSIYNRINTFSNYLDYQQKKVNKYPIGTAVLESPFFLVGLSTATENTNGYETHFHKIIFYSALFYLFLGLIFFKLLLKKYEVKWYIIFICQLLITLATSLTIYTSFDAAYSHVYSFFAIIAFAYFVKSYFTSYQMKHFLWACFFLGLIIIIRQVNILVIFSIPFLAGSFAELKKGLAAIFTNYNKLILGLVLMAGVISIQLFAWYFQTGNFIVYSYQGEGFNFSSPEIFKVLFSYEKGLFVYTPILFLCVLSSSYFIIKKQFYLFFSWILFLVILVYVFSSWWSWYYGCSYGMRPFVDFYAFFFIPLALLLNHLKWYINIPIILFSASLVPINTIQSYQYKNHIIDWGMLNKEDYWKIFLHTEDQYKGYVHKREESTANLTSVFNYSIPKITLNRERNTVSIPIEISKNDSISSINKVKVTFNNQFNSHLSSDFIIALHNGEENLYWHSTYLLHFSKKPNFYQKGTYLFNIETLDFSKPLTLNIEITKSGNIEILDNFQITVYGK